MTPLFKFSNIKKTFGLEKRPAFEILLVWLISIALAMPAYLLIFNWIKHFVETNFANHALNIPVIFDRPDLLCPGVLLATLGLALLAVFLRIRDVLKHSVAVILRSGE